MAHRDDAVPLGQALGQVLARLAARGHASALGPIWREVAGPAAVAASRPVAFEQGVLRVECDSKGWVAALREQEALLRARLVERLPGFVELVLAERGGAP